jgi:hypothetical protein
LQFGDESLPVRSFPFLLSQLSLTVLPHLMSAFFVPTLMPLFSEASLAFALVFPFSGLPAFIPPRLRNRCGDWQWQGNARQKQASTSHHGSP